MVSSDSRLLRAAHAAASLARAASVPHIGRRQHDGLPIRQPANAFASQLRPDMQAGKTNLTADRRQQALPIARANSGDGEVPAFRVRTDHHVDLDRDGRPESSRLWHAPHLAEQWEHSLIRQDP
jgi:hypothetical protein